MNLKLVLGSALLLGGLFAAASPLRAETLTLDKTVVRAVDAPRRGLSMSQVERRYGAPVAKLPAAGGDAPRHPTINRWRYQRFTVYFERDRVLHSVRDGA